MRRFKLGLVLALTVAVALPFVLPQVVEENVEVVIGKANNAKAPRARAHKAQFRDRDFAGALAAYEDLIERFPNAEEASEALFRIANIHHWEYVAPATAIPAYERMIDAFPGSDYAVEARLRIGECRARMKDYEGAIAECDRVLDEPPESRHVPLALLTKGNIYLFDTHDRDAAATAYSTLVGEHAGTPQADEARIQQTYMAPRRLLPGEEERRARDPHAELKVDPTDELARLQVYRDILAGSEDAQVKATAQYMIAFSHFLQTDYEGAIREAKRMLDDYPDTYGDQRAQGHYFIALMHERIARYDAALTTLQEGLAAHPDNLRVDKMQRAAARVERKMARLSTGGGT